jgi:glutaredoxin
VAGRPIVRMYSRRTCGLCDEARALIQAEQASFSFQFDEVFIDDDPSLEREYGLRVPVVELDGVEEFEFAVDAARLQEVIARSNSC